MNTRNEKVRRPRRLWLGFAALFSLAGMIASCTTIVGTFEQSSGTQTGCNVPADCPDPANACVFNTCTNHVCGTQPQAIGFNLTPNATHDCHGTQCDGNGNVQPVLDVMNLPVETNPCVKGTCSNDGTPGTSMVAAETTCMTNQVCDGSGNCVICVQSSDCTSGMACTPSHMCVPSGCTDGVKNGNETDQDCGGGTCGPCADGKACATNTDCIDKVCTNGVCQASTCTDGVQNGGETDTDCGGGTCNPCGPNLKCMVANDCAGKQCAAGTCTPDCSDGVQNNVETDQDCGGGTCGPCAVGKKCLVDTDCSSQACDLTTLVCVADQCKDHRPDGAETDTDCGGSTCPGCIVGKKCAMNSDCASDACDANTMLCTSLTCMDGQKDQNETDQDCGGPACLPCATGKKCLLDRDCSSSACDANTLLCVVNQCADHQQDGLETDSDCGGGTCPTCATGKNCGVNGDCVSNACDNLTGKCVASQCVDQKQDGAETDQDCGGGVCTTCALGKHCGLDTDCASNACDGLSHLCVAMQCSDHQQDGLETDSDCGGGACSTCGQGLKCKADSDCTSNACDGSSLLCVANQCSDHRQDNTETDSDCGGTTCTARCATGLKCKIDADCVTQACDAQAFVCVATQCVDHQKDGSETDQDCGGGGTCPTCLVGKGCLANSDCASGFCDNVTGVCASGECTDQKKDGAETDIDCGGGTCGTCGTNKGCLLDTDCTSNACDGLSLVCVTDQCSDHRKDGAETDKDCGGGICPTCGLTAKCVADSDCASNACDVSTLTCVSNQCADHRQDGNESDVDCGGNMCQACLSGQHCNTSFDCQAGHPCNASTHLCP